MSLVEEKSLPRIIRAAIENIPDEMELFYNTVLIQSSVFDE